VNGRQFLRGLGQGHDKGWLDAATQKMASSSGPIGAAENDMGMNGHLIILPSDLPDHAQDFEPFVLEWHMVETLSVFIEEGELHVLQATDRGERRISNVLVADKPEEAVEGLLSGLEDQLERPLRPFAKQSAMHVTTVPAPLPIAHASGRSLPRGLEGSSRGTQLSDAVLDEA
jgi:hypothetical protein